MRTVIAACVVLLGLSQAGWAQDTTTIAAPPTQTPARTGAYMNMGFDALVDFGTSTARNVRALQRGDHDPAVRGFTIPNDEITLDGNVDPYFKAFANIVYKLNEAGDTELELEEAYAITTALPANLQLKAGQFVTEFGRQNAQHPHTWAFVDQPLVLNRMFGPDGLRSQGVRISWLAPTAFYSEFMLSVLNSTGGTTWSFRSPESNEIHGGAVFQDSLTRAGDMLIVPRFSTSFDLSGTQTVVAGVSAAFGPNSSGPDARTSIYGADLYYKWKPDAAQAGFPFVSWQTEWLHRNYEAGPLPEPGNTGSTLARQNLRDSGWYSQLLWGIKPRIVAGLRYDYANGNHTALDNELRARRTRISPDLTIYPSEFSKVRFQYNYDDRAGIGTDHSFWMQFEFMIGAHAAHKF